MNITHRNHFRQTLDRRLENMLSLIFDNLVNRNCNKRKEERTIIKNRYNSTEYMDDLFKTYKTRVGERVGMYCRKKIYYAN